MTESSAAADAIEASIHHLPEDLREALLLAQADGLTFAEIAAILGVSEATLRQRVDEARHCIRRSLAEHDDLPLAEDALVTSVDAVVRRMIGAAADVPADPPPLRQRIRERFAGWLRSLAAAGPAAARPLGWRPSAARLVPALGAGVTVLLLAIVPPLLFPPPADPEGMLANVRPPLPPPATADDAGGFTGLEGASADLRPSAFELAKGEYDEVAEQALNAFDRPEADAWSDFARAVEQANEALQRACDAAVPAGIQCPAAVAVAAEPIAGDLF